MQYKLIDLPNGRRPIIPWRYIFNSLSVPQFAQVSAELDFPVEPDENLRQIAYDFSLTYTIMMRNSDNAAALGMILQDGAKPSVNLLVDVPADAPYLARRDTVFANTFARLEQAGYAEAVYQWSLETEDFYWYEDVSALRNWSSLLLYWAVLEQVNHPVMPDSDHAEGWDAVVAKWSPFYTQEPPPGFSKRVLPPLQLPTDSLTAIRSCVLTEEAKRLHLDNTLEEILSSPLPQWDKFVFRNNACAAWLGSEGSFRMGKREWHTIKAALPPEDMETLKMWAYSNAGYYSGLKNPLGDNWKPDISQ
jgi:hypothetical protein